jgi:hypothetical protein
LREKHNKGKRLALMAVRRRQAERELTITVVEKENDDA